MSNLIPTAGDFATMKELGNMAIRSGFLPTSIKTPEQAVVIMLKGREIGIPPMQAFSSIAVVSGKPTMSAELMLSMIYRNVPGAIVNFLVTDANQCSIEARRPNGKFTKFSFTMEDAKRANLTGKGPWVTYPAAMLRARCISAMARAMFPDALSGIVYTPEELGAQVNDDGEILDVPTETKPREIEAQALFDDKEPFPGAEEEPEMHPGEYVVKVGKKYFGQRLKDIPNRDLENYLDWIEENASNRGVPLSAEASFFKVAVGRYFNSQTADERSAYDDAKAAR
jgi:hypothetical protein